MQIAIARSGAPIAIAPEATPVAQVGSAKLGA
jgi:hypothetical protein